MKVNCSTFAHAVFDTFQKYHVKHKEYREEIEQVHGISQNIETFKDNAVPKFRQYVKNAIQTHNIKTESGDFVFDNTKKMEETFADIMTGMFLCRPQLVLFIRSKKEVEKINPFDESKHANALYSCQLYIDMQRKKIKIKEIERKTKVEDDLFNFLCEETIQDLDQLLLPLCSPLVAATPPPPPPQPSTSGVQQAPRKEMRKITETSSADSDEEEEEEEGGGGGEFLSKKRKVHTLSDDSSDDEQQPPPPKQKKSETKKPMVKKDSVYVDGATTTDLCTHVNKYAKTRAKASEEYIDKHYNMIDNAFTVAIILAKRMRSLVKDNPLKFVVDSDEQLIECSCKKMCHQHCVPKFNLKAVPGRRARNSKP